MIEVLGMKKGLEVEVAGMKKGLEVEVAGNKNGSWRGKWRGMRMAIYCWQMR